MKARIQQSLQAKILLYVFGYISLVLIIGVILLINQQEINKLNQVERAFNKASHYVEIAAHAQSRFMLEGRKEEKFLKTKSSKEIIIADSNLKKAARLLDSMLVSEIIQSRDMIEETRELKQAVDTYRQTLKKLVSKIYIRGFKDFGLEGMMRGYVHDLQELDDTHEQIFALSLRRHEKDFMLRKDLSYIDKINSTSAKFKNYIVTNDGDSGIYKIRIIDNYVENFNHIVEIEKEIGLTKTDGLRWELAQSRASFAPVIGEIERKLSVINNRRINTNRVIIISSLISFLTFSFILANRFNKVITRPVKKLNELIKGYSIGKKIDKNKFVDLYKNDELGSLVKSFRNMYLSVEESIQTSRDAQTKLEKSSHEIEKRNWYSEQLNMLIDTFKSTADNNYDYILNSIVEVSNAKLGAIYRLSEENDEEVMKMNSCYAFSRKKYLTNTFSRGQGLIGAAWTEKSPIYRTEIPSNYMNITSGLGEVKPSYLVIIPLIHEGKVEGILELGFLKRPEILIEKLLQEFGTRLASEFHLSSLQRERVETLEYYQKLIESKTTVKINNTNTSLADSAAIKVVEKVFKGLLITNSSFQMQFANNWFKNTIGITEVKGDIAYYIAKRDRNKLSEYLNSIRSLRTDNKKIEIELSGRSKDTIVSLRVFSVKIKGQRHLIWLFNPYNFSKIDDAIQNLFDSGSLLLSRD